MKKPMKLRIEFIESKSPTLKNVLRVCRKLKGFREYEEEGMKVYSVEFTDEQMESFIAVRNMVGSWKGVTYYKDDVLTSAGEIVRLIYNELYSISNRKLENNRIINFLLENQDN